MAIVNVYERLGIKPELEAVHTLQLNHEQRDKGRLKAVANDETEVRRFLERGKPLIVGEKRSADCGAIIEITGAVEDVLVARCNDWPTFSKACYHLGNRHVKVEVGDLELAIKPDHVLADMLVLLGLDCEMSQRVFVPESGAYSGGHHHAH